MAMASRHPMLPRLESLVLRGSLGHCRRKFEALPLVRKENMPGFHQRRQGVRMLSRFRTIDPC